MYNKQVVVVVEGDPVSSLLYSYGTWKWRWKQPNSIQINPISHFWQHNLIKKNENLLIDHNIEKSKILNKSKHLCLWCKRKFTVHFHLLSRVTQSFFSKESSLKSSRTASIYSCRKQPPCLVEWHQWQFYLNHQMKGFLSRVPTTLFSLQRAPLM